MINQKNISTLTGMVIILAVAIIIFSGVFVWQNYAIKKNNQLQIIGAEKMEWKSFCFNGNSICFKYPSKFCYDKNDCRDLYVVNNFDAFIVGTKVKNDTSEYIQPSVFINYGNMADKSTAEGYLRRKNSLPENTLIPWTLSKNELVFTTTSKLVPIYAGFSEKTWYLVWFETNFACFFDCGQVEKTFLNSIMLDGIKIYSETKNKKVISEQEAINIVRNLPEVKKWLTLFNGSNSTSSTTGGKPIIEIDSVGDGIYVMHAYEQLPDHTASFNYYNVNTNTGKVDPMFK